MQLPEVNEVNEEPPSFNEEDWIGKGLQYLKDKDAPLALKYYIDAIPDAVKDERTPSCNLTTTWSSLNDINMIPQANTRKMGSSLPVRQIWGLAKKFKPNPASG